MIAAALLLIALIATTDAAFAQEGPAFNEADPVVQQAIRNSRAIAEASQKDVASALPAPNSYSYAPSPPPRQGDQIGATDEQVGITWGKPANSRVAASVGATDAKPGPNPFDQFDHPGVGGPTTPTAPVSPPDCRDLPDGGFTADDAQGRCPELDKARARSIRRTAAADFAAKSLASAIALLLLGRGIRYVLANE